MRARVQQAAGGVSQGREGPRRRLLPELQPRQRSSEAGAPKRKCRSHAKISAAASLPPRYPCSKLAQCLGPPLKFSCSVETLVVSSVRRNRNPLSKASHKMSLLPGQIVKTDCQDRLPGQSARANSLGRIKQNLRNRRKSTKCLLRNTTK